MRVRFLRPLIQIAFLLLFVAAFSGLVSEPRLISALNSTSLLSAVSRLSWLEWSLWILVAPALLVLTWLFGRVYCSYYCPVGFLQDLGARVSRLIGLRIPVRAGKWSGRSRAFFLFLVFGLMFFHVSAWQYFDHYSLFGKIVLLTPLGLVLAVALVLISLRFPRWFCVGVCPAGTIFSLFERRARLQIRRPSREEGKCGNCLLCQRACPSICIRVDGTVDRTRCIQCFECVGACIQGKIQLGWTWWKKRSKPHAAAEPDDSGRREFLKVGAMAVAGAVLANPLGEQAKKFLLPVFESALGSSDGAILPPGAGGWDLFHSRCLGCGMCVSSCPSKVIKLRNGYPVMDYSRSFCGYECNACMSACPAGALASHTLESKKRIRIGQAELRKQYCVVYRDKMDCGACAEHCPTGAILTRHWGPGLLAPVLNEARCVGCGACQHICPGEPAKAMVVRPVRVQTIAAEPGVTIEEQLPPGGQGRGQQRNRQEHRQEQSEGGKNNDFPF